MASVWQDIGVFVSGLRDVGSEHVWQSLRHRLRSAYWRRAYAAPPISSEAPEFLGDLQGYAPLAETSTGAGSERPGGVDLICARGVLRVEFPAEGVARVRLSRSRQFPILSSYAVAGLEPGRTAEAAGDGAGARHRAALPDGAASASPAVPDTSGPLTFAGNGISVEVTTWPCRLTFKDALGRVLGQDAAGAGWQGSGVVCSQRLFPGEAVYGLGEKAFSLNRRGLRLTMWNTDPASYQSGADPLYQSTPFVLGQWSDATGPLAAGVFFDNTYRVVFDLGKENRDTLLYSAAGGELCYYVLAGPAMPDVLARFTALTGHMPMPPRWGLGYHQSRWSYGNEDEFRRVADTLRSHRIPCDALYLDIDYMDGYRVFTWDEERFPNPPRMIADLRARGLRTVTIIDPGVKVDPKYAVCAEGLAQDVFCKLPDGRPYIGPVWPGDCYFPDFPNARARAWWGRLYKPLLDMGVAGFWNDMNEPAIFFGATFPEAVQHNADNGPTDHRALHNVYGQCMLRAVAEAMRRDNPDERMVLISRSAYAGIQRYGITWTGDNRSTWDQLRLSIPLVLNMGLSGQAFTGPDVAGFSGDATGELLVRWTAMGVFMPLFRNHSALGTVPQEPYVFGEPYESLCRRYIELRYRLLPYLYTAFWQAAESGLPVVRPLALAFPTDRRVASLDDQFFSGDALMVAPVVEEGAQGRGVYLPAGGWYDFWTGSYLEGGQDLSAHVPLEALPLYVRAGSVVPMGPVMQHTEEFVPKELELHVFAGTGASHLYEDDGHSLAYQRGERRITRFDLVANDVGLTLTRVADGAHDPGYGGYAVLLRGLPRQPENMTVVVDGRPVTAWDTDTEWNAPRITAGMFERIEITWRS